MNIKTKSICVLAFLGIVDVLIPLPIVCLILIYLIVRQPPWFPDLIHEIYSQK